MQVPGNQPQSQGSADTPCPGRLDSQLGAAAGGLISDQTVGLCACTGMDVNKVCACVCGCVCEHVESLLCL